MNSGLFLEKVYLRLHENVLKISLKVVYERILRPEVQASLTYINIFRCITHSTMKWQHTRNTGGDVTDLVSTGSHFTATSSER